MQRMLLKAEGLKKSFNSGKKNNFILRGITCSFDQNKTYAIRGASGTGKSTLIHLLAGLDAPTAGSVLFNNRNLQKMSAVEHEQFLQKEVGLLFQLPYLIKELSVLENVMLPTRIAGVLEDDAREAALHILERVGLFSKKDALPSTLSGGQQARVALARALINRPSFLLADEPTGNLDEKTGKGITQLLVKLQKEWNIGLIISTHDSYVADAMEITYRLHDGLIEAGD